MALSRRRSEAGLKNCSFALKFSKREQRKKCLIERALVLDEKQFPYREFIEMQIFANRVVRIHHGKITDYEKEDCKNKNSTVGRSGAFDDGR